MNNTLNMYNIKFATSKDFALWNRIQTTNIWLSQFIGDHYTIAEANRLLIGVTDILNENSTTKYEFDTQSQQVAIINSLITNIYKDIDDYEANNSIDPDFSLPTIDFKTIIEEWKNYLVNSPLKLGQ